MGRIPSNNVSKEKADAETLQSKFSKKIMEPPQPYRRPFSPNQINGLIRYPSTLSVDDKNQPSKSQKETDRMYAIILLFAWSSAGFLFGTHRWADMLIGLNSCWRNAIHGTLYLVFLAIYLTGTNYIQTHRISCASVETEFVTSSLKCLFEVQPKEYFIWFVTTYMALSINYWRSWMDFAMICVPRIGDQTPCRALIIGCGIGACFSIHTCCWLSWIQWKFLADRHNGIIIQLILTVTLIPPISIGFLTAMDIFLRRRAAKRKHKTYVQ